MTLNSAFSAEFTSLKEPFNTITTTELITEFGCWRARWYLTLRG
jgi:hypothetical protein